MKKRIPNTESTVGERLRLVIGAIALFTGIVTIALIGSFSNYSDTTVWIIGLALIIGGILIANSLKLAEFISGLW